MVLKTGDNESDISRVPTRLFMTFKFFTFPESNTTDCRLFEESSEAEIRKPEINKSYGLVRENYDENKVDIEEKKSCSLEFRIDPSTSKVKDENLALVRYLKERILSIDLFDSYSRMHFGTVKLPLFTLLRQGKDLKSSGQECDVCEPKYGRIIGKLQVIMTNHIVPPADPDYLKNKSKRNQPSQKKHRYKHVHSKPLSLTEVGEGSFQHHLTTFISSKADKDDEQARQQLRIEKMKKRKMQQNLVEGKTEEIEDWERKTTLNHISFIREQQKPDVIENLIKTHKNIEKDLEVRPGEPAFLSILVANNSKRTDVYSVKIIDPDGDMLHKPELCLVHNVNHEWKYWHENGKCVDPPAWDMVDDGGNIYLDAKEQCPMLFKFFSYRETTVHSKKGGLSDPRTLSPRTITVKVYQQSDEALIKHITINIIPRPNPIDHIFRFYAAENTYSTITLPTFTSIPLSAYPDLFLESSLPHAEAQIAENDQVQINLRTPYSPEIVEFSLYIYRDSFRHHILAACVIKVHALTAFSITVRTGLRMPVNLPVFSTRRQQSIRIYTDEPEVVSEVSQKPIALESDGSTIVQLSVKT